MIFDFLMRTKVLISRLIYRECLTLVLVRKLKRETATYSVGRVSYAQVKYSHASRYSKVLLPVSLMLVCVSVFIGWLTLYYVLLMPEDFAAVHGILYSAKLLRTCIFKKVGLPNKCRGGT